MKKIAIFSSSEGSNAANIIRYFRNHPSISVSVLISDRSSSLALSKARDLGVKTLFFEFFKNGFPPDLPILLKNEEIDLVVLAGYFSLLPSQMINDFKRKIINIHPSLLPAYGGKGYYSDRPLREALEDKSPLSGITIHYVDELYDHGDIIFKKKCMIDKEDTLETLQKKLKELEFAYFPLIIENILMNQNKKLFFEESIL